MSKSDCQTKVRSVRRRSGDEPFPRNGVHVEPRRGVASPVDDRAQNGRVCQKYVALTGANAAGYIA